MATSKRTSAVVGLCLGRAADYKAGGDLDMVCPSSALPVKRSKALSCLMGPLLPPMSSIAHEPRFVIANTTPLQTMASYPPSGLAPTVDHLPEWIKLGLGDKEYMCDEKKATFDADNLPEKLPDLSKHSSYMAELMCEKPELYDQLKGKTTKNGEHPARLVS
ncbi:Creatine kinase S-type, mitochondrial, partial [Perkinsus olseni]